LHGPALEHPAALQKLHVERPVLLPLRRRLRQRPPGVLELPPGCDEALAASSDGKAHRLSACNVDDLADLWDYFCLLPTWDQDLDGVPDNCDLCPFAFDPGNQIYVDENDKEWPNSGKYCNGEYALGNYEIDNNCMPVP
jgi:hypothetical protein